MLCETCGKADATIHVKTVVNGVKQDRHLCETCADEGILDLAPGPIAEAVETLFSPATKAAVQSLLPKVQAAGGATAGDEIRCPSCGMTLAEFHRRGRLGCPKDYEIFEDALATILRKIHGSDTHRGSRPSRVAPSVPPDQVTALRNLLDEAVGAEDYEEAARLRDRLRALERTCDEPPPA